MLDALIQMCDELLRQKPLVLVGIDGCGGAGKSTLAGLLVKWAGRGMVVHMDDFYKLPAQRQDLDMASGEPGCGYDIDRLRSQVLDPLRRGQPGHLWRNDWESDVLIDDGPISPQGLIVVEGCYALLKSLRGYYDLKGFVDCPRELRLRRGLERDGEAARDFWLQWMEAEDRYLALQRPRDAADFVLDGSQPYDRGRMGPKMTERLHLHDSSMRDFTADIVAVDPSPNGFWVRLNRTAFYAESGGQPDDRGDIAGVPVLRVQLRDGEPWHELTALPEGRSGLACHVDWARRLDHMQQHLGQHLLSAVLYARGAATVGFHLGEQEVTIDLNRELPVQELAEAEAAVNALIWENRPVQVRFPDAAELAAMRLRSLPEVQQDIRIIDVEGVDQCPCGGTHPDATGAVGSLLLLGSERHKGGLRVRFVCGGRAVAHSRGQHVLVGRLCTALSVGTDAMADRVEALLQENRALKKENEAQRGELLRVEALSLLARQDAEHKLLASDLGPRPFDDARALAALLGQQGVTALLAVEEAQGARVVLASPAELGRDMGELLKAAIAALGGRGGGSAGMAQGVLNCHAQQALEQIKTLITE